MMIVCWQGFLLLASDDKPKSSLPQKGVLQSALYKTASVFNWLKLKIGGSVFHKFSKKKFRITFVHKSVSGDPDTVVNIT